MKKLLIILTAAILSLPLSAQRHEFGFFIGTSYYLGDLAESNFFGQASPAYGLSHRFMINPRLALRSNIYYGTIMGDDALSSNDVNKARNLHFKSSLLELGMNLEVNFFEFVPGSQLSRFTPYISGGFAVFRFNPMAQFSYVDGGSLQEEWFELQPLGTEGQGTTAYPDRDPYALTQVALPFGIGFKWAVSQKVTISGEWGLRKTFTDYLDDVSTTYADPYILASENGPFSMVLANRMFENLPGYNGDWGEPYDPGTGTGVPQSFPNYPKEEAALFTDAQRGNSENNDWYSFAGLTITFQIVGPRQKSCPAYKRHFNYKEFFIF